ncbi:M24 family metallopeptidase [Hoyosella altamirensis]|uniref:Xaa-Pro dipeptidase n=1 Tax=Hoyosella altamirensis TaxID=616997 RepID=A0A839RKV3_9ACTN|nr:Xaa-Pro peptidase family protein [Hoyosella altamirensis]MBB3036693.1 Xaa-Pro dipeptidase [Hoyosella altamirensis]
MSPVPNLLPLGECATPPWLSDPDRLSAVSGAEEPSFPAAEYEQRLSRVRAAMAGAGLDALVVSRPAAVEYLCGYFSAETIPQPVLVTGSDLVLFVPDFEVGRAVASSCAPEVRYFRYAVAHLAYANVGDHVAHQVGTTARVGTDSRTPIAIVDGLRGASVSVATGADITDTVRLVMSPAEISAVEKAAESTQRGVEAGIAAAAAPGATDAQVAAAISAGLVERATSRSAWQVVVATGKRAGIPHSTWRNLPLVDGSTFLEFAGTHHRYHAPIMRSVCRGEPSALVKTLANLSETCVAAVLETARAGVACRDVAEQVTKALGPLPDGVVFHELYGYPVGLAHPPHWMDGAPFNITIDNPEPLEAGMVFHMPGSFRSIGLGGVGLSQTFVIEENGTRPLTHGKAEMVYL